MRACAQPGDKVGIRLNKESIGFPFSILWRRPGGKVGIRITKESAGFPFSLVWRQRFSFPLPPSPPPNLLSSFSWPYQYQARLPLYGAVAREKRGSSQRQGISLDQQQFLLNLCGGLLRAGVFRTCRSLNLLSFLRPLGAILALELPALAVS